MRNHDTVASETGLSVPARASQKSVRETEAASLAGPRRSPGTVYDSDEARNPVDTFHDRDWLATLMMLLGRLEYART
ncbi:MAG: hypothetical protein ACRCZF_00940, partial [Gemmataceae bacterium]